MKVVCRKLFDAMGNSMDEPSIWLTVDKEYVVLGVRILKKHGLHICIQSDHLNQPIFPSIKGFEITSQSVPANWRSHIDEFGDLYLLPESWMYETFLDDIDDDEPKAREIFIKEAALIYAEEGYSLEQYGSS